MKIIKMFCFLPAAAFGVFVGLFFESFAIGLADGREAVREFNDKYFSKNKAS